MTKKYFTIEEANELLPAVKRELTQLQRIKQSHDEKYAILQSLKVAYADAAIDEQEDPCFELECSLDFMNIEARTHMQSLERMGVELKDIEIGLVDFPALLHGEEVLLCWRMGEERICFFHGRDSGFMGRRSIEG